MPERWARWLTRGAAALLALGALYYATLGGEYSAFHLRQLRAEHAATTARLDSLRAVADSLATWADSLEVDPLAVERVARERYGYIRDGDRLYRFVPAPPADRRRGAN